MKRKKKVKSLEKLSPYLYILPSASLFVGFLLYPLCSTVFLSFHQWDGVSPNKSFVGMENFFSLLYDARFWTALVNNIIWTILSLFIPTLVGLVLAVLLHRLKYGDIYRGLIFIPVVLPTAAVGLIWTWVYNPIFGLLNAFFQSIGLNQLARDWLGSSTTALYAVFVAASWAYIPLAMCIFYSGLQGISREYYDAASIDGANALTSFLYVTLPLLRETITHILVINLVGSFAVFDIVYVMTAGGPGYASEVISTYVYDAAFYQYKMGYASAIAVVALIIVSLTAIFQVRARSREKIEM